MNFTMQSGLHAAIIMDGNGRWATSRSLPRSEGHRAGAEALRRAVESAPSFGISVLTVYAFSSDNWKRPRAEVETLFALLSWYLAKEISNCVDNSVRVTAIGRRDRLGKALANAIERTERETARGTRLHLRLAIDYSGRDVLRGAAQHALGDAERFETALNALPPVDLLIRTGGEQRLSDFLLWESAYAELFFLPVLWPDFNVSHLGEVLRCFRNRERRFGGLPKPSMLERWLA